MTHLWPSHWPGRSTIRLIPTIVDIVKLGIKFVKEFGATTTSRDTSNWLEERNYFAVVNLQWGGEIPCHHCCGSSSSSPNFNGFWYSRTSTAEGRHPVRIIKMSDLDSEISLSCQLSWTSSSSECSHSSCEQHTPFVSPFPLPGEKLAVNTSSCDFVTHIWGPNLFLVSPTLLTRRNLIWWSIYGYGPRESTCICVNFQALWKARLSPTIRSLSFLTLASY